MEGERGRPWLLLSPPLTAVALLLVIPLFFIVAYSFWRHLPAGNDLPGLHFGNWQAVLTDVFYRDILGRTLRIAAVTTLICALLGYVPAYFIAMTRMKNRTVLLVLLMLPFWISYIIRTMSWINILGVSGVLNKVLLGLGLISEPVRLLYSESAVVLGLVHYLLPFMILNVYVGLIGVERSLLEAGVSLGASAWQTFWEVTFPLSLPGLAAGSLLCFVLAAGTYVTPQILGGPTDAMFANLIYESAITQLDWPMASALALALLAVLSVFVVLYNRFAGMAQISKALG